MIKENPETFYESNHVDPALCILSVWCTCTSQPHTTFPRGNSMQIPFRSNAEADSCWLAGCFQNLQGPFCLFHMFKVLL